MADKPGNDSGADGRRPAGVPTDSARFKILVLLNERSADDGEIAEELGLRVGEAAGELKRMLEAALIEVAEGRRGRIGPSLAPGFGAGAIGR